ncbi:MAG: hypothetical protein ACXVI5_06015 [Halobacteriota archaeon]
MRWTCKKPVSLKLSVKREVTRVLEAVIALGLQSWIGILEIVGAVGTVVFDMVGVVVAVLEFFVG